MPHRPFARRRGAASATTIGQEAVGHAVLQKMLGVCLPLRMVNEFGFSVRKQPKLGVLQLIFRFGGN